MKKIIPLLLFALFTFFWGQAQTYNIVKAQAFSQTSTAGNIPVDETNTPTSTGVTKEYLIFIETMGTVFPQWETAYIDGLPYSIRTEEVLHTPLKLGLLEGKKTSITVSKGDNNRLWQLVLTPRHTEKSKQTKSAKAITLSGTFQNKSFTYKISKVQELAKRFHP